MTAQAPTETRYEELTRRGSNGIRVSLMWNRADNELKVVVYDDATDSAFELPVGDSAPLDVFNHPYAYAASRGITCDDTLCEAPPDPVAA
jgi:hypothetical protein